MWPARLRRLAVSSPAGAPSSLSRLARFAVVSRQGAPRSKLTRLPDPVASPHQFLHDKSEYKVYLRHNYDSTWRAIRACANTVTTYFVPQLLFAAELGQRKLDTLLRHTTVDDRELGWQTHLVPKPR